MGKKEKEKTMHAVVSADSFIFERAEKNVKINGGNRIRANNSGCKRRYFPKDYLYVH